MTYVEAVVKASGVILHDFEDQPWPEDDWIDLGPDWDLNLSEDAEGMPCAVIYPVVDGNTITTPGSEHVLF